MDVHVADLAWLPEPPADFLEQVRGLHNDGLWPRSVAKALAGYRLSGNQLHSLGKAISRLAAPNPDSLRLGVLSNGTLDLLQPAIVASALRYGIWLKLVASGFDQVAIQALDSDSAVNRARCNFVLLVVDHRGLPLAATPGHASAARAAIEASLNHIDAVRAGLRAACGCTVIVQTVPQVETNLFGSMDRMIVGTLPWMIDEFNRALRERIASSSDLLLDAAALAEVIGLARWHDPTHWALGKFLFSHTVVPLYVDWLGRLIAAARGKARKCLVLDLDGTVWGGVVGDDGLPGIVLGNGSPAGEAFLSVQHTALALRARGIALAVASKNDDAVARSVFRSHPEMVLREEHISVFQANWLDKAANLRAIARTLNIGTDALVLLDDNPAERAQVRQELPEVAVPELPDDPALFSRILLSAGYFEAVRFTAEDRQRAAQLQANAVRAELLGKSSDLEAYLRSLEMRMTWRPFDRIGRARITQLINKTNQFNLTTRRYTEAEVERLETCSSGATLQIRLADRFGDNGMIAVVICRDEDGDWVIDSWLMSCRVLNRKVEQATLNQLVSMARAAGVRALIGQYLETERNRIVKDHYARLGFTPLDSCGHRWRLEGASYVPVPVPIQVLTQSEPAADVA